jgi:alkanesulfonate monooxygenase SsuD/methylene tetrahydromethanopterin reductase-like flavin-dependent oxidoreductase (luciferase family)
MKIAIGLPNPIPGTDGETLIEWARRADTAGFSSLATIDRIVYPSYEPLTALAAAAAATERIGLVPNILIAPARDAAMLAKVTASVDRLSGGRLVLGLGVGGRKDDFEAVGRDFSTRGRYFDHQLERMNSLWKGEEVSATGKATVPQPGRVIPILVGGRSDKVVERVVRWGVGYTAGGGGAELMAPIAKKVRAAWAEAGREGEPRLVALTYFALGPDAEEGRSYIKDYYAVVGPRADRMAASLPTSTETLKEVVSSLADLGVDELVCDPTIARLDQVDRLADALL